MVTTRARVTTITKKKKVTTLNEDPNQSWHVLAEVTEKSNSMAMETLDLVLVLSPLWINS